MLNVTDKLGKLKTGMIANFIITSGNLFDEKTIVYENWIQGNAYKINDHNTIDVRGNYALTYNSKNNCQLKIEGEIDKLKATVLADTAKMTANIVVSGNSVSITFNPKDMTGTLRLSGSIETDPLKMTGDNGLDNIRKQLLTMYRSAKTKQIFLDNPEILDMVYSKEHSAVHKTKLRNIFNEIKSRF